MSKRPSQPEQPRSGQVFEMPETPSAYKQRTGQIFDISNQQLEQINQASDADNTESPSQTLLQLETETKFKLEKLPFKGLRVFGYSLLALFLSLISFEIYQLIQSALNSHWMIATLMLSVIAAVVITSARLIFNFIRDDDNIGKVQQFRRQAERMKTGHDYDPKQDFVKQLHQFYLGKPQMPLLRKSIDSLEDYHDNKEIVEHLERTFLNQLDQHAFKRISTFAAQTGAAVALSPWASLDMLLSLWRNTKMLNEMGQIYGLRPSLRNRWKLFKSVINQLILVGTTELALQQLIEEMGLSSTAGIFSARIGQGLGAGVYTAKIGLAAMQVARPIPFAESSKPKLKNLIGPLLGQLKALK